MISIPNEIYWIIAGIASILYGINCFKIHSFSSLPQAKEAVYAEYIFNGLGALVGWIALYFLIHLPWTNPESFGWQHFILSYIAFIGITGQLPFVAKFGFIKS